MSKKPEEKVNINWMLPNRKCWVEQPKAEGTEEEIFIPGKILNGEVPEKIQVLLSKQGAQVPSEATASLVHEANEEIDENGIEDMVNMACMNEAELLNNVRTRYKKDMIFTYIGPTLMVLNPYKSLASEFTEEMIKKYEKQVRNSDIFQLKDNPPHVFAISALAYRQLFENNKNQAIVISGESGAGKTENAKYAMMFLTSLSKDSQKKAEASKDVPIEEKILSCNPILEAFGNAKTVRNDNSSRFGKYVRILVEINSRKIQGAAITNYLLEKSRVTVQAPGERNYHIFYHLMRGAPVEHLKKYGLTGPDDKPLEMNKFFYMNQSDCYEVPALDDKKLFEEVFTSLEKMNFKTSEKDSIWSALAAILHLGNIEFDDKTFSDTSPCTITNPELVALVAKILRSDENIIRKALLYKTREVGKQVIESPVIKSECISARDSFSRGLYDKLFTWLVKRLNFTILPPSDLAGAASIRKSVQAVRKSLMVSNTHRLSIGLLDIFGFENFKINSFEQLCINFTNEKLQQLYINYIFKSEEKEFIDEGLKDFLTQLNYKDNQAVIDLIDKYPMGMFDLLDESTSLGSGTDDQLLKKFVTIHKDHPNFQVPKAVRDTFTIIHTAKNVEYTITGFRNKNKDEVSKEIDNSILKSKNEELVRIYQGICEGEKKPSGNTLDVSSASISIAPKGGKAKSDKFAGAKFRNQMKDLMTELISCDVHFIRCLKPNELKKKDYFIPAYCLLQIRYLGVLESIKIRKEGYPQRKEYKQFFQIYTELDRKGWQTPFVKHVQNKSDFKALSEVIIKNVIPNAGPAEVLFGKTKVYLRNEVSQKLDLALSQLWKEKGKKANKIIKQYKHYLMKKTVKKNLRRIHAGVKVVVKLQAMKKRKDQRKKFLLKKESVKKIKVIRKKTLRREFLHWHKNFVLLKKALCIKLLFKIIKRAHLINLKKRAQAKTKWLKEEEEKRQRLLREQELERKRIEEQKELEKKMAEQALLKKKQDEEEMLRRKKEEEEERRRQEEENQKRRQAELEAQQRGEQEAEERKKKQEEERKKKQEEEDEKQKKQEEDKRKKQEEEELKKKQAEEQGHHKKEAGKKKGVTFNEEAPKAEPQKQEEEERDIEEAKNEYDGGGRKKTTPLEDQNLSEMKVGFQKTEKMALSRTLTQFAPEVESKENSMIELYTSSSEEEFIARGNPNSQAPYSADGFIDLKKLDSGVLSSINGNPFTDAAEKLIGKKTSWGKTIPYEKIMTYSHKKLGFHLLQSLDKNDQNTSQKVFDMLMKYLDDKEELSSLEIAKGIVLSLFSSSPGLKDETYLLMCKQLNGCPNDFFLMKLYKLIAFTALAFPPSKQLFWPVLNFLYNKCGTETEENKILAKYALVRILKTQEVPARRAPPTDREFAAVNMLKLINVEINFPYGRTILIPVESYYPSLMAKENLMRKLEITIRSAYYGFFLETTIDNKIEQERFLEDDEVFMDLIAFNEKRKLELGKKNKKYGFKIFLKIRVFFKLLPHDIDTVSMYFSQHLKDYIDGKYPISEADAFTLSAMAMLAEYGPYDEFKDKEYNYRTFIPTHLLERNAPQVWIDKICSQFVMLGDRDKREVKLAFLDLLKKYEFFMSHQYLVHYMGLGKNEKGEQVETAKEKIILAVKPLVLVFAEEISRQIKSVYEFKRIDKWGMSGENIFVLVTDDGMIHFFECEEAKSIDYLVRSYTNLAMGKGLSVQLAVSEETVG